MKRILLILLTAALFISAIGCVGTPNSKEQEKIGIRGLITKVSMSDDKEVSAILVEGKVESDTIYDKAMVSIDKNTKISADTSKKISANELKEDMKVEIIFEGPVAESYPVQGKAKSIRVID